MNPTINIPKEFREFDTPVIIGETINYDVVETLEKKELWAVFLSTHFTGRIWFENYKWLCQVWVNNLHTDTFVAPNIERFFRLTKNIGRTKIIKPYREHK